MQRPNPVPARGRGRPSPGPAHERTQEARVASWPGWATRRPLSRPTAQRIPRTRRTSKQQQARMARSVHMVSCWRPAMSCTKALSLQSVLKVRPDLSEHCRSGASCSTPPTMRDPCHRDPRGYRVAEVGTEETGAPPARNRTLTGPSRTRRVSPPGEVFWWFSSLSLSFDFCFGAGV